VAAWLICIVYGATDEIHQRFVEGRMADAADWAADTAGAALAIAAVRLLAGIRGGTRRTL
jgi:VanZ family protein